jgi:thiosulfate dehydrogenase (quinone) large subunit
MNIQYIQKIMWIKFRIIMGLIFLWAFFDKTFGLGFATAPEKAWINGGSPTYGYLMNATHGPFMEFFQSLAGVSLVDWLFMLGLLGVGTAFLIKRYVMFAAICGSVMMFLMWISAFPPENNPLLDDHIVYIFALLTIAFQVQKEKKIK